MKLVCSIFFFLVLVSGDPVWAETAAKTSFEGGAATQDLAASMFKVIGGLLVVILAIFASAWFYRKFGNLQTISHDSLKIIGGLNINQKDRVVLLQVGDEQLLVGVSPGRIKTLHVLNKPIEIEASTEQQKENFSSQLNSAIKNWKSS